MVWGPDIVLNQYWKEIRERIILNLKFAPQTWWRRRQRDGGRESFTFPPAGAKVEIDRNKPDSNIGTFRVVEWQVNSCVRINWGLTWKSFFWLRIWGVLRESLRVWWLGHFGVHQWREVLGGSTRSGPKAGPLGGYWGGGTLAHFQVMLLSLQITQSFCRPSWSSSSLRHPSHNTLVPTGSEYCSSAINTTSLVAAQVNHCQNLLVF